MSTKFKGQEEFYCPNCELGPWGFWEIATGMCPICMEKMIKEDETLNVKRLYAVADLNHKSKIEKQNLI